MVTGLLDESHPWRVRLQAAYGYLVLVGWVGLTVVGMAYKLFPMWVWKERFQAACGERPVPGAPDSRGDQKSLPHGRSGLWPGPPEPEGETS